MNDRKVLGYGSTGLPIYAMEGRGSAAANRMLANLAKTTEERVAAAREHLAIIEQQLQVQRELLEKVQNRLHFKWQLTAAEKSVELWSNKADEARAVLARVIDNNTEEVLLDNNTGRN